MSWNLTFISEEEFIDHVRATIQKYGDKPVGLNTIAALTGDEASTIEDYLEPFLIQLGMLQRTPRGRVVTDLAKKHLGLE